MKLQHTTKSIEHWGKSVVATAKKNLKVSGFGGQKTGRRKESSGALGRGLGYKVNRNKAGLILHFTSKKKYARNVEEGRRPNSKTPPIHSIIRWIKQKPIQLREVVVNKHGQKINKFARKDAKSIRRAAFGIAKSIGKKGIKPAPFFSEAMDQEFDRLPKFIQESLVQDLEDFAFDKFVKQGYKVTKK